LKVPKLRTLPLESAIIDRYRRRESSVEEALVEMYLAGVSARRVEDITEALWDSRAGSFGSLPDAGVDRACPVLCVVFQPFRDAFESGLAYRSDGRIPKGGQRLRHVVLTRRPYNNSKITGECTRLGCIISKSPLCPNISENYQGIYYLMYGNWLGFLGS
jgi:hypothetical protein